MGKIYTRQELIDELLRFEDKYKKVPSYNDIQNDEDFPPVSAYLREFGKWKNALNEVPFKNQDEVKKREVKVYSDQELIDFLLKREKELGRIPEQDDMDVNLGYPCVDVYASRFGSWSGIKERVFYNKDWLKQYLIGVKDKLGRIPRSRDMIEDNGLIPVTRFVSVFSSWNNAIEETFYTKEYADKELLNFEKEHGRVPTTADFQNVKGKIPYHRIEKIYGSWSEAKYNTQFESTIDHSFFSPENMNSWKWYIIGRIIGDGCVSDNGCLIIRTAEIDKENLIEMHKYMKIDTKINVSEKGKGHQLSYSISKFSPQWVKDLAKHGIVPRKSHSAFIPLDYLKTPEEEAAILRGIFDSDGGINYRSYGSKFKPVFFVCGSKKTMEDYAYLLKKNCNIDCNLYKHGSIFRLQVGSLDECKLIYNFLYGHENFYIKRKKERFEKLFDGTFTKENDPYYVN